MTFELCALNFVLCMSRFILWALRSAVGRQLDFGDIALSTKDKVQRPNLGFAL
jgi:hypothetical protein